MIRNDQGVFSIRMNPPGSPPSVNVVMHQSSPSSVLVFPPRVLSSSTNYINMFDGGDEASHDPPPFDSDSHKAGGRGGCCMLFGFSLMEAAKVASCNSGLPP